MCIATRCTSVEQFIQMFHRFVDEDSFFVSTHNTRPPGLETSFSVQLADGTPVLRGLCVVLQVWANANNPFKTPGVRLGIKRLTANSMPVFERLLLTRSAPPATPVVMPPPPPRQDAFDNAKTKLAAPPKAPTRDDTAVDDDEPEIETRTPGSDYVLPANPLMNLTDESLEGYVDCTLYEETGNFFPAEEDPEGPVDDLIPPPVLAPRPVAARASSPVAITTPPPMPIVSAPIDMSGLMKIDAPPAAPVVTVTSVSALMPMAPPTPAPVVAAPPPIAAVPMSATLSRETPVPAGERVDLEPTASRRRTSLHRRTRPRYWMLGGFGVLAAATLGIVINAKSSSGSSSPPVASAPETPREIVAQAEPTPIPAPPSDPAIEDSRPDPAAPHTPPPPTNDDPPGDGPPVLGTGPCKLAIATTPAGSMISVDGKVLAPSPLTIATTCETHQVDIAHPRYKPATKQVALTADKPGSLDISLDRPTHAVSVTSTPPGATIFIDGRRAGTTPTVVSVMGFQTLKLEIKKTGYQPQSTKLYSKVPQDKVAVRLTKW